MDDPTSSNSSNRTGQLLTAFHLQILGVMNGVVVVERILQWIIYSYPLLQAPVSWGLGLEQTFRHLWQLTITADLLPKDPLRTYDYNSDLIMGVPYQML
jgi:hypothetical protein